MNDGSRLAADTLSGVYKSTIDSGSSEELQKKLETRGWCITQENISVAGSHQSIQLSTYPEDQRMLIFDGVKAQARYVEAEYLSSESSEELRNNGWDVVDPTSKRTIFVRTIGEDRLYKKYKATFNTPEYGDKAAGTPEYRDKRLSGVPESYLSIIEEVATQNVKEGGGVFLDVGGGTGDLSEKIEERIGLRGLSLDYSHFGFEQRGRSGAVADAERLPVASGSVKIAHLKDVIVHFDNPKLVAVIGEIERVLGSDGKLIITDRDFGPHSQKKRSVSVENIDTSWVEKLLPGETLLQAGERLVRTYNSGLGKVPIMGNVLNFGLVDYSRSMKEIVSLVRQQGFNLEKTIDWVGDNDEPEWYGPTPLPRKVMVFNKNDQIVRSRVLQRIFG
jgi:ubiquinone/menaquinone biosynthesis C-methylase UbiE